MNFSNQRKIVVSIESDGSTSIDAQGFTGSACSLATKELEQVLTAGGEVTDDKKKPDFYATRTGSATHKL